MAKNWKEIKLKGSELVDKVREIIDEGNARKLIIKKDEHVYMEIPLNVGVGGAIATLWLSPLLAALGALAALLADVSVVIIPKDQPDGPAELEESETEEME